MATKEERINELAEESLKYFSHDTNAHEDIKCKKLLRRYGPAGYGRFWLLCEALGYAHGHKIQLQTDDDLELLTDELRFKEPGECMEYLEGLKEIGLIEMPAKGFIWSNRMMKNARYFGEKRLRGHNGAVRRWQKKRESTDTTEEE